MSSCRFTLVLIISRLQSGLPGPVNLLIDCPLSLRVNGRPCVCVFFSYTRRDADKLENFPTPWFERHYMTEKTHLQNYDFITFHIDKHTQLQCFRLESHLKSIADCGKYACRGAGEIKGMKGAKGMKERRFILKDTVSSRAS